MAWLFLTPPTCATGSYMRVMKAILKSPDRVKNISDDFWSSGNIKAMETYVPDPDDNKVFVWNTLQHWNWNIDSSHYGTIVNFRDPRDLACNQFHWALQHENPNVSQEELQRFRDGIRNTGIDAFVLQEANYRYNLSIYSTLRKIIRAHHSSKIMAATYAQICLGFDDMLKRMCNFFEIPLTNEIINACALERPEAITSNEQWWRMTGKYAGHDFAPGRHKLELKAETIEVLTDIYRDPLTFCREWEIEEFKHLY